MDSNQIKQKLKAANLGKTYLYVLVNKQFDLYCPNKMLLFFPNKLDAMVSKIIHGNNTYKIVKFDEMSPVIKKLIATHINEERIEPMVVLGYITSSVNGKPAFVVPDNTKTPTFHAISMPLEQIEGGLDLNNYLMEHIINDEVDENKVVEQLIFSNLCTDEKLEEAANFIIDLAKKDGIQTDKNISIRHMFAYQDKRDLETIWGI